MTEPNKDQLLETAGNANVELKNRLRSLEQLAASGDASLVLGLQALLSRSRPPAIPRLKNWDVEGAERVVDLHITEALFRLGDDSELHRIVPLVAAAGSILSGPYDELRIAVTVILAIGRKQLVASLTEVAGSGAIPAVRNAVRTLGQLGLPMAPVRQDLVGVPHIHEPVSFKIDTLREEMETIASRSKGAITLSPGVRAFITEQDYERGRVERKDTPLAETIEEDLDRLEFDYYVERNHVIICTYQEAGARWQAWWTTHGPTLTYNKEKRLFALAAGE